MGKYPFQCRTINLFQPARHERLFFAFTQHLVSGKQVAAHDRGQRDRYDHRCKKGNDERNAQRPQHSSFHPAEEKERNERDDGDDCGMYDRGAYFGRCVVYDVQRRAPLCFREPEILLEPFEDVFHVDDRIVHQRSDGNGHTAETHRVDGKAHQFERENRYEQRERQCYQRDDRRAHVHQKEEQYHYDEKRPFEQGFLDVVDRSFDKAGLTETVGRQVDIRRKLCLDLGDRFVELFGQFQ